MLDNIKTIFTIKDLENLSGVKAHTIRIWEQRYGILEPKRTETNIRFYDIENLRKLLNVKLLNESGVKISKIAALTPEQLNIMVKEQIALLEKDDAVMNAFKLAMIQFDYPLFEQTYSQLLNRKSIREIFLDYLVPLLNEVGLLWQSNTITPAQEHFISNIVKQKLYAFIDRLPAIAPEKKDRVFVLFLPLNEIHELGLLYIHYEIVLHGFRSVYLGQSVPLQSLETLADNFDNIVFVSYFTVKPSAEELPQYLAQLNETVLSKHKNHQCWILGNKLKEIDPSGLPDKVFVFNSISGLCEKI